MFTPRRQLGKTGFVATQLGIGDLADRALPLETLVATVRRAMDAGLNLIDTAPAYEDGYSEQVVGSALAGSRRQGMFVIDKIDHLRQPVADQIDGSLRRLMMDHTDAFVFHGCSTMEDWQHIIAPGGGMDQLDASIKAGKTRFAGISSHDPEVLLAALNTGRCQVVLFPIGAYADARYESQVLPLAKRLGVGTVCFKSFGAGKLLGDTSGYNRPLAHRPRGKVSSGGHDEASPTLPRLTVEQCLHYTLTIDPDVALLGLSFPNEQDAAFAAFESFNPLPAAKLAETRKQATAAIAGKGDVWWNPSPRAA
jgi:aryl-alcohol dehydrogenase-like predicted oxidoreductase